jgi:hypothetical protein
LLHDWEMLRVLNRCRLQGDPPQGAVPTEQLDEWRASAYRRLAGLLGTAELQFESRVVKEEAPRWPAGKWLQRSRDQATAGSYQGFDGSQVSATTGPHGYVKSVPASRTVQQADMTVPARGELLLVTTPFGAGVGRVTDAMVCDAVKGIRSRLHSVAG